MLKTWIPGTTDFRDQGLDPTDWVNDNVEMATDGKLGKCLYFNGSNARLSSNTYSISEKWSWSVWVKDDPDVTGWRIVFILNSNGSDADTQTALWVKADETRLEVCNDAKWVSTVKYVPGQWNHIAQTYDGTTTNVYLNGSRISGFTSTDHLVRTNMTIGGRSTSVDGGHVSANTYYKGYLNDFRIWDNEVLSPQQIKRLSQGLVLHYPLNNNGFGNENLVLNSDTFATGYGASGITPSTTSDGLHQVIAASGNSNWHSSWATSTATSLLEDAFAEGDPFTISFTIKSEDANNTNPPSIYVKSGMGYYSMQGNVGPNWSTVYYSGTWKDTNSISFHLGFSGHTGTYLFKNWKVEKGTKPTPWCPNKNDELATTMGMNDGVEYDCSGLGNNGTKVGTITWDSNTARYNSCYAMTGTSYINCGKPYEFIPDGSDEFTVNMWAYEDAWDTSTQLCSCTEAGGFSLSTGNNAVTCYCHVYRDSSILTNSSGETITNSSGDTILLSTSAQYIAFTQSYTLSSGWHMFTMVYTKEGLKIYVDGSLVRNSESSSIGLHYNKNCNLFIGAEANGSGGCTSPYLEGKASDYRLFSTALDDDSILALYNLGGSLDSNGVFHTYEYTEQ